jgi:hypothetical protein
MFNFSLKMDLRLTPLSLVLNGLVTIEIPIVNIVKELFRKKIWGYSTPSITKPMVNNVKNEEDKSPPQFSNPVDSAVR